MVASRRPGKYKASGGAVPCSVVPSGSAEPAPGAPPPRSGTSSLAAFSKGCCGRTAPNHRGGVDWWDGTNGRLAWVVPENKKKIGAAIITVATAAKNEVLNDPTIVVFAC